jgi:hypothetical protein
MARFAAGVLAGVIIATVAGAALGLRADEPSRDIHEAAAAAQVDPVDLQGAVNSTGVDPWTYLRGVGELSSPPSVTPPRSIWDTLASCEASGNWANASNPKYKGGLQMDSTFWARYGGLAFAPAPHLATRAQQIVVAERGLAVQGWSAWPACSRRLGLR